MANRETFDVEAPQSDVQIVTIRLKGAGASAMVPQASANGFASDCVDVSRTSAGLFALTFRHAYAELLQVIPSSRGSTAGLKPRISAIDVGAKTATLHVETFGDGTAAAYQTGVSVAAHTATLAQAGAVVLVEATTATSAGVKTIKSTATPGAGAVQVTYSAGVPTLTFNAGDNVTVATVLQIPGDATAQAVDPGTDDYVDITLVLRNSRLN